MENNMVITHCNFKEFKKRHPEITAYKMIAWEDLKLGTKSGNSVYGNCDHMVVMNCIPSEKDGSIATVYLTDCIG